MHLCVLLQAAKLLSGYIKYKSFFPQNMQNPGRETILNHKVLKDEWMNDSVFSSYDMFSFCWRGKDNEKRFYYR